MRNQTLPLRRAPALLPLLAVSLLLAAGSAGAAISTGFAAGVYTATSDGGDAIVVTCRPEIEGGGRLVVNINDFEIGETIDCFSVARFNIFGGPGDNVIDLSQVGAEFTAFTGSEIHGGPGGDDITGSRLADLIIGDAGDDDALGLGGDDAFIWNNGDNTDEVALGDGDDRVTVNGSTNATTGDAFEIAQVGSFVRLQRTNLVPFSVSMSSAESLIVNGLDGNDSINASTLPAGIVALSLNGNGGNDDIRGSLGVDSIDGGPGDDTLAGFPGAGGTEVILGGDGNDTNTWNNGDNTDHFIGGAGNDTQIVNGAPVGDQMTIGVPVVGEPGTVAFRRTNLVPFNVFLSDAENLVVNGLAGDDVIDATTLDAGLIALTLNGGDGADQLFGSRGDDQMDGGAGDDALVGRQGNDRQTGGDGDDRFTWNNGDNTDQFFGEAGDDRAIVNGANNAATGDQFVIARSASGARFDRTNLVPFGIDIETIETLEVNSLDGADRVSTEGLAGIAQVLDGGAPAIFPADVLLVVGVADPRLSPVLIAGAAPITHQNFEFEGAAAPAVPIPALDAVGAVLLAAILLLLAFAALRTRRARRA